VSEAAVASHAGAVLLLLLLLMLLVLLPLVRHTAASSCAES
jgi:hypothetical protein